MVLGITKERRRAPRSVGDEPFSATHARKRAARIYVCWVMPSILLMVTGLTLLQWIIEPSDIPLVVWGACATFWTVQVGCIAFVRSGRDPLVIAGLSLVAAAGIEFAAMFDSAEPVGASATMTFFIVVASYFLPAWVTMVFAASCAAGITYASTHIDAWGEGYAFPSTAFVALITGATCAFIMSRVRRTEERLERVAAEQVAARERLEQVDRARDRLIANVSHELRTPLTSTIGSIETLMRDDLSIDDDQRAQLMRVARDGGHRLLALVEDLLTIGATRPDSLQLSTEPELLGALAQDALVGIDPGFGRSINVRIQHDPLVRVDRLRLLLVIANLAVNAIRHGQGNVDVETDVDDDGRAILRVIDDGPGVAPEHVNELFLPFARFSTRSDSTGLGLAICRTLIEAHEGTIDYTRTRDGRTSFVVTLPTVLVPTTHA
jgi:signal transduction histidine kinase